ncbi:MAG: carboxypeptidase regulatory-like domain-containing protein [Deltaproteobacteria bacterium]|nr:carboxypeptidase regulatory-like domain-containing protein [Deltaproteobacteria bacterium]
MTKSGQLSEPVKRHRTARVAVTTCVLGSLALAAWWLLRSEDAATASDATTTALEAGGTTAAAPRARGRASSDGGASAASETVIRGVIRNAAGPVGGASVLATGAAPEDVLSGMMCQCSNRCGRRLLECGCGEAAAQLLDVVGRRLGEPPPLGFARSASDGSYELRGTGDQPVAVWAEADGAVGVRVDVRAGELAADVLLAPGQFLAGRAVTDSDQPVGGAVVTAIYAPHSRFFEVTSAADGRFRVGPVPAGDYTLVASAGALLPGHTRTEGRDGEHTIKLYSAKRLHGRVLDNDEPAAGMAVRLDGEHKKLETRTAPDGTYAFPGLRPGSYSLEAGDETRGAFASATVREGTTECVVDLVLHACGSLRGTVRDVERRPVAGAEVKASLSDTASWKSRESARRTDPAGHFSVAPLAAGSFTVTVSADGYVTHRSEPIRVEAGAATALDVVLAPAATLQGIIVNPEGAPLTGVSISAVLSGGGPAEPQWARSHDDGTFSVTGLAPGEYALRLAHDDYLPRSLSARAPDARLRVVLEPGGVVAGVVVNGRDEPVVGARVHASAPEERKEETLRSTTTGKQGEFQLRGLEDGAWKVEARPPGAGPASAEAVVTVAHGSAPPVRLVVDEGQFIDGVVVDMQQRPVAEVMLSAVNEAPQSEAAADGRPGRAFGHSDPDGTFSLHGVHPGRVILVARKRGYLQVLPDAGALVVEAPQSDVRVVLRPLGRVRGRVVDGRANPVRTFTVNNEAFANATGAFEVRVDRPGPLALHVVADGYAPYHREVTAPDDADLEVEDVVLGRGRVLRGQVLSAARAPVAGAQVTVVVADAGDFFVMSPEKPASAGATTDATGSFVLKNVPDTAATLSAVHPDHAPGRATAAPGVETLEIVLAAGGVIRGRISNAKGEPWPRVRVNLAGGGSAFVAPQATDTGPDGTYRFSGLTAGKYFIMAFPVAAGKRAPFREVSSAASMLKAAADLPEGAEVTVDLAEPADGSTLTVRLVPSAGAGAMGVLVAGAQGSIQSAEDLVSLMMAGRMADTTAGNALVFRNVPGGAHTLVVIKHDPTGGPAYFTAPVQMGSGDQSVEIAVPETLHRLAMPGAASSPGARR